MIRRRRLRDMTPADWQQVERDEFARDEARWNAEQERPGEVDRAPYDPKEHPF